MCRWNCFQVRSIHSYTGVGDGSGETTAPVVSVVLMPCELLPLDGVLADSRAAVRWGEEQTNREDAQAFEKVVRPFLRRAAL